MEQFVKCILVIIVNVVSVRRALAEAADTLS